MYQVYILNKVIKKKLWQVKKIKLNLFIHTQSFILKKTKYIRLSLKLCLNFFLPYHKFHQSHNKANLASHYFLLTDQLFLTQLFQTE